MNKVLVLALYFSFIILPFFLASGSNDTLNLPPFNPQIDDQVQEIMNQTYIPSVATTVIRNNSIIWARGYGEQPELDKIYMTGSVTKTFTATAIFQLYEQGLIQLDDDVNEYLPFSLRHPIYQSDSITIRMLLTHTSGISKDTDTYIAGMAEDGLSRMGWENPYAWLPYPEWIKEYLTPNGSLYDPGAWTPYYPGLTRHYSNIGYNILGYILELITGKPIWEYVQENILTPLEMHHTGFNLSKFDISQLAIPYIYKFEIDPESNGNKAYPHYNYLGYSSGAIRSNIYDLARFLLVHLHAGVSNGTRILQAHTIQTMHQMQASWLKDIEFWNGWGGTEGDIYGFHTKAYGIYDHNTSVPYGVITLVNQGMDDARDACFSITQLLQRAVHRYDVDLTSRSSPGLSMVTSVIYLVIVVILVKKKLRKDSM